jgi:dolichyl-phosphate beta-glucosyltransferase
VPAYNELRRLPATLAQLVAVLSDQPLTSRVVVVDNGSFDDTAAAARAWDSTIVPVTVIGCAEPGKGAAVLRGLRTSRARWAGFVDADLSTPPATIGRAVAELQAGAVAAIASRHAPGARVAEAQPLGRRLGGTAFRALARPLVKGVHDADVRLATRQEILGGPGLALVATPLLHAVTSG